MKIIPTPLTAALAGAFTGSVMPMLWARLADDGTLLVVAFLLVVALPAHALVVGFGSPQAAAARAVDKPLLQRVGAWLLSAIAAVLAVRAFLA